MAKHVEMARVLAGVLLLAPASALADGHAGVAVKNALSRGPRPYARLWFGGRASRANIEINAQHVPASYGSAARGGTRAVVRRSLLNVVTNGAHGSIVVRTHGPTWRHRFTQRFATRLDPSEGAPLAGLFGRYQGKDAGAPVALSEKQVRDLTDVRVGAAIRGLLFREKFSRGAAGGAIGLVAGTLVTSLLTPVLTPAVALAALPLGIGLGIRTAARRGYSKSLRAMVSDGAVERVARATIEDLRGGEPLARLDRREWRAILGSKRGAWDPVQDMSRDQINQEFWKIVGAETTGQAAARGIRSIERYLADQGGATTE